MPFLFEKYVYKWLEIALDYGIDETNYWNMTLAEVIRAIESKKRQQKLQAQERASYDYILADLIGRSVSRIYSNSTRLPQIYEVYPTLFDGAEMEEQKQQKQMEISAIRFKLFAQSYNKKHTTEVAKEQ